MIDLRYRNKNELSASNHCEMFNVSEMQREIATQTTIQYFLLYPIDATDINNGGYINMNYYIS